jgi:hypothetical protein
MLIFHDANDVSGKRVYDISAKIIGRHLSKKSLCGGPSATERRKGLRRTIFVATIPQNPVQMHHRACILSFRP